jgi:hypothetical protein
VPNADSSTRRVFECIAAWRALDDPLRVRYPGLRIVNDDDVRGRRLFASRSIAAGSIVCCYAGACTRLRRGGRPCYVFSLMSRGQTWYVDATNCNDEIGRCINHSMQRPNVAARVESHPADAKLPCIVIVAVSIIGK